MVLFFLLVSQVFLKCMFYGVFYEQSSKNNLFNFSCQRSFVRWRNATEIWPWWRSSRCRRTKKWPKPFPSWWTPIWRTSFRWRRWKLSIQVSFQLILCLFFYYLLCLFIIDRLEYKSRISLEIILLALLGLYFGSRFLIFKGKKGTYFSLAHTLFFFFSS